MNRLLVPVGRDKHGEKYSQENVTLFIAKDILNGDYFTRRAKAMNKDIDTARELTEKAITELDRSITRFLSLEERFAENAKRVTGKVRDASQRLAEGIARVEKAASLSTLEKHCAVLERMAESLERLAELEASGRLRRISDALSND